MIRKSGIRTEYKASICCWINDKWTNVLYITPCKILLHAMPKNKLMSDYLLNVSQRLWVPAQLLLLLLVGVRAGLGIDLCRWGATQWTKWGVKDHLIMPDQELNNECLIGVIHQRRKGNFSVGLPWFDQCWTKDDTEVAGCHLILLRLLCHTGEGKDSFSL